MVLKAKEFPDIWVFTNECPAPPPDYPKDSRVSVFMDVFLTPQYFGRIIVWKVPKWSSASYFKNDEHDYQLFENLEDAEMYRYILEDLCEGGGHMSVLCVSCSPDMFLATVLKKGHYGEPREVTLGTRSNNDPLQWKHGQDVSFLESSTAFHNKYDYTQQA